MFQMREDLATRLEVVSWIGASAVNQQALAVNGEGLRVRAPACVALPVNASSGRTSRSRSSRTIGSVLLRTASARFMLASTSPIRGANCKQAIFMATRYDARGGASNGCLRYCATNGQIRAGGKLRKRETIFITSLSYWLRHVAKRIRGSGAEGKKITGSGLLPPPHMREILPTESSTG